MDSLACLGKVYNVRLLSVILFGLDFIGVDLIVTQYDIIQELFKKYGTNRKLINDDFDGEDSSNKYSSIVEPKIYDIIFESSSNYCL